MSHQQGAEIGEPRRSSVSQDTDARHDRAGCSARRFGCRRRDWSTLLKRWEQEENCPISTDDSSSLVSSSSESKWRYLSERAESKSQSRQGRHPVSRLPTEPRWDLHPQGSCVTADSPVPNPRRVLG